MSGNQNKWPHGPHHDEDDQTPVPAPTVPQGWTGGHAPVQQPFGNPPTGQMNVNQFGNQPGQMNQFGNPPTGQMPIGQFGNPPTGQMPAAPFGNPPTGQFQTNPYANPPTPHSPVGNPATGAFATGVGNPVTGQMNVQQFGNPPTGQMNMNQFGGTGTFDRPVLHAPVATPPPMKAVFVVTPQIRAMYGGAGATFGLVAGLFLGILNSALEGASFVAGIPVTLQISMWFALLFGITCATKPERVAKVLRDFGVMD